MTEIKFGALVCQTRSQLATDGYSVFYVLIKNRVFCNGSLEAPVLSDS